MLRLILGPVCVFLMLFTAASLAGPTEPVSSPMPGPDHAYSCCGGKGEVPPPQPIKYNELGKLVRGLKGKVIVVDLWNDG